MKQTNYCADPFGMHKLKEYHIASGLAKGSKGEEAA